MGELSAGEKIRLAYQQSLQPKKKIQKKKPTPIASLRKSIAALKKTGDPHTPPKVKATKAKMKKVVRKCSTCKQPGHQKNSMLCPAKLTQVRTPLLTVQQSKITDFM